MTNQRTLRRRSISILLSIVVLTITIDLSPWISKQIRAQVQPVVPSINLANQARSILADRCAQCHGQNDKAAGNVLVLDRDRLLAAKTVVPGDTNSPLLRMVESGVMPLGGQKLSNEEIAILRSWVIDGAPAWNKSHEEPDSQRATLPEAALVSWIREDLERAPQRSRQYLRYFSLAHLYNAGATDEELAGYRLALAKLINSLSWHRTITPPQAIDPAKTILRIDLRDYNWTSASWNAILAAYPYGVLTPSNELVERLSGQVLPYLRADWFTATASTPPLYNELLRLPATLEGLELQLGIDADRDMAEEKNIVRAGLRASRVSTNNRVLERHVTTQGAYWRSYDFRSSVDSQNIFNDPLNLTPNGGEMIFTLPNGLQGYFISDSRGQRIDAAPIDIVADRTSPDSTVIRNGQSCIRCHYAGVQPFKDEMRPVVENLPIASNGGRYDREKVLSLYPSQAVLDQFLAEDGARFRHAMAQLETSAGITASNAGEGLHSEPIDRLVRAYKSDLTVTAAAAELGLLPQEFQARLRSSRLSESGVSSLLAASGGVSRDAWAGQFSGIVQDLQIGYPISGPAIIRGKTQAMTIPSGAKPLLVLPAGTTAARAEPSVVLRSARTIFVMSNSVYMTPSLVENELRKIPAFKLLDLVIVNDRQAADMIVQLDRPLFTFTYTYSMHNPATSIVLANGKTTALSGEIAAPKIARELIKRILEVRPLPGNPIKR